MSWLKIYFWKRCTVAHLSKSPKCKISYYVYPFLYESIIHHAARQSDEELKFPDYVGKPWDTNWRPLNKDLVSRNPVLSMNAVQKKQKILSLNFCTVRITGLDHFSQFPVIANCYLVHSNSSFSVCKTSWAYFYLSEFNIGFYLVHLDLSCTLCRTGLDFLPSAFLQNFF